MQHVLAQVEDSHPACIILDWNLPGRPTRERISVLRALIPDIKIIVMNTSPELRQQVLNDGANAFICKTDPPSKLLEAIQELCEGKLTK
jgi:DNA-binding NarL/FixJ family response regulator